MPLYEYQCDACGKRFEKIIRKYSDPPPETCPHCGKGPITKLFSSPAIQFKGSGWYITDYARKSSGESGSESKSTSSSSASKDSAASKDSGSTASSASPATKSDTAKKD